MAKSISPDWTSQPKTPTERSQRPNYRFTSIKHSFLRSEELATKTGRWEKFQTPHKGSYNKLQFSADPDTHVFECEKNLRPSAAKFVVFLRSKTLVPWIPEKCPGEKRASATQLGKSCFLLAKHTFLLECTMPAAGLLSRSIKKHKFSHILTKRNSLRCTTRHFGFRAPPAV